MAHPRIKAERRHREESAIQRVVERHNHVVDANRYAELLHHGNGADAATVKECRELGRKLGKSNEQIDHDLRSLKHTAPAQPVKG